MTYKVFEAGETLSANDVMTYFMNQMVTQEATYADLADLPADIKVAYVLADDTVYALLGSTWTPLAYSGEDFTVGDLVVNGDLTVSGTTTSISSTTLEVEDKNIVINKGGTTDASADGAGITIEGTSNKTLNWVDATDAFTASEHINLASGKAFKLNGTDIKDVSETLTNKTISGASNTLSNIGNGSLTNSSITIGSTSTSLGATNTTISGLTLSSPTISSITNTGTITLPSTTGTLALTSEVINNSLTTTTGDTIYASSANTPARLSIGTSGQVLTVSGGGIPSWTTPSSGYTLPSQSGNSGKYLTTNGTAESWGSVTAYSLPSQTSNSGKVLTTNGSSESWSSLTLDEIQIQSVMDIY